MHSELWLGGFYPIIFSVTTILEKKTVGDFFCQESNQQIKGQPKFLLWRNTERCSWQTSETAPAAAAAAAAAANCHRNRSRSQNCRTLHIRPSSFNHKTCHSPNSGSNCESEWSTTIAMAWYPSLSKDSAAIFSPLRPMIWERPCKNCQPQSWRFLRNCKLA